MLLVIGRHAHGPRHHRQFPCGLLFGCLNASFDIAYAVEIFGELATVTRTETFRKPGHLLRYDVENATVFLDATKALRRIRAVTLPEEPLEYRTRIVFHGERRCGGPPGERVEIGVTVGAVTSATSLAGLQGKF